MGSRAYAVIIRSVHRVCLFTASVLAGQPVALAAGAQPPVALPAPVEAASLMTLSRSVTAAGHDNGLLLVLPHQENFVMQTQFRPGGATRSERFGSITDSRRVELGPPQQRYNWNGVAFSSTRAMLLDGEALTITEVDRTSLKLVAQRSVPWDTIRPPRDRGGEPTGPETAREKQRFRKAWLSTPGLKITGMARIPREWMGMGPKTAGGPALSHYLLAARLPGFPLLLMECQDEEVAVCMLTRFCNLAGAKDLPADAVSGIAVSPKTRRVLIGDRAGHRLLGFKFHSCFEVTRQRDLLVPPQIRHLTNIYLDVDERLWLTAGVPDDYLNASLFFWEQLPL